MRVCFCKHTRILFLNTNKKHRYIFMIFTRMKNLLCFVFICLTFTVFAQDKRANLHKLDSLALDSLNDIEIQIISFISDDQPGFVECVFTDAWEHEHKVKEKVPIVTKKYLDAFSY